MTTLREAAQLALEYISWQAFGECRIGEGPIPEAKDVVRALRKALAEPEQPARVPLTQPDKQRLWNDACHNNRSSANDAAMEFGTLVEAAHGIMPVCFGPHDPVQE